MNIHLEVISLERQFRQLIM